jgi:hypothetical protein
LGEGLDSTWHRSELIKKLWGAEPREGRKVALLFGRTWHGEERAALEFDLERQGRF